MAFDLDAIFQNKGMKAILMKKAMRSLFDNGVKSVIITIDDKGDYKIDTFLEPMATISKEKLSVLIDVIKNYKPETNTTNEQS